MLYAHLSALVRQREDDQMSDVICYWRGSAEVRDDLVAALEEHRFEVLLARGIEDVLDTLEEEKVAAVIVDGSAGQREASDRVIEITNTEALHNVPLIFISSQASKRVSLLQNRIQHIYPLDVPYHLQHVIRGIRLLIDSEGEIERQSIVEIMNFPVSAGGVEIVQSEVVPVTTGETIEDARPAPAMAAPVSPAPVSTEPSSSSSSLERITVEEQSAPSSDAPAGATSEKRSGRKRVESNSEQNRARLKENTDPSRLTNTYGGQVFSIATDASDFDDDALFPEGEKREMLQRAFAAFEKMDPWAGVHARRVAFVGSAIANSLSFNKVQEQNVRLTCLFINWATPEREFCNPRRHDVLREPKPEALQEIANAFRASAALIRERLQEERSARTVELVAKMIAGEGALTAEQKELVSEAECVLIVELADRACWSEGYWNSFGVYRTMRQLRSDSKLISGRPVKASMKRVLGEAVTAHVTVGNIFISNDDLETVQERRSPIVGARTAQSAGADHNPARIRSLTIQIADLLPGMRLAEPLKAKDGKLILDRHVCLDQDMVFQLWQLAALRALSKEIVIQVEV